MIEVPNPALAKFGTSITVYASYDQSVVADLSDGDGQPVNVKAPIQLEQGLRGNAFLAGQGAQSFTYQDKDNLNLSKSGAVAVWISPQQWQRDPEKIPTFPIFSASSYGQWLLLGRMGSKVNQEKLYAFNQVGGSKSEQKAHALSGNTLNWKDGEWHLLVCNWRDDAIEFSHDGATPIRTQTPWRAEAKGDPGLFTIGAAINYSEPSILQQYLVDELMVFSRPLQVDEIKWLYAQLESPEG